MISVAEADRLLGDQVPAPRTERVTLAGAQGRILAEAVRADRDGPPFDRAAMDGWALGTAPGTGPWEAGGFQAAGRPPLGGPEPGKALEIATGAVVPRGFDTVVPYEDVLREGETLSLRPGVPVPSPGQHIHRRGADFRQGQILLEAGTPLRSPHLHVLASVGCVQVPVVRRAVWDLISTGDELVDPDQTPLDWQIRRSNPSALAAEASAWGLAPRAQGTLPDEPRAMAALLAPRLGDLDVLVLTGGVSAGALDLVPGVLTALGAVTLFHKLTQRPGKPLWCGKIPGGPLVFGLPGNPVASLVAFRRYVVPWLLAFEGRKLPAVTVPAPSLPAPPPGWTQFLPWIKGQGTRGPLGSGDVWGLASSTGVIEFNGFAERVAYHSWGPDPTDW